jgi:hypothetical protein
MMLQCNVAAVTDFHFPYKILIFNYFCGADRPGEAFAGAKYEAGRPRHARIATAKGGLPGALRYRFLRVRTCEHCLVSCGENSNPAPGHDMRSASGVLAPALSEPKARSRAPARRLCDGVRRSGRPRAASPSTAVTRRGAQRPPALRRRNSYFIAVGCKVAARGRAARPTKRGRIARNKENFLVGRGYKQASLFHAYLRSMAYASFVPTEMSFFVRMKFGT